MIILALLLAILIKTFLVQAFYIPSGSMENTLQVRDRVLVNKVVYHFRDIRRGEVVVFNGLDSFSPEVTVAEPTNPVGKGLRWLAGLLGFAPPGERDFIKRVIGLPGDHVQCCDAQGRIMVNGVPLDEPYLYPGNAPSTVSFDITVPDGRLWVMGDHRALSQDSRSHLGDPGGGTVPANKVIGRAFVVVWPISHWKLLSVPQTFQQPRLDAAALGLVTSPAVLGVAGAIPLSRRFNRRRQRQGRLSDRRSRGAVVAPSRSDAA